MADLNKLRERFTILTGQADSLEKKAWVWHFHILLLTSTVAEVAMFYRGNL